MAAEKKLRFQVVVVDGRYRASCPSPRIDASAARLMSLRANVAAAIGAALGEARPFALMVGRKAAPPGGQRKKVISPPVG
jgi:hypothetical protein